MTGPDSSEFENKPRCYALALIDECGISERTMLLALLNYMSNDDVRDCLDNNEMSPRFFDPEEE